MHPQAQARRLARLHAAIAAPSTSGGAAATVTVVVLGGPQTGGDLRKVIAPAASVELVDARSLFQGEYAETWPAEVIAKFLDSGGAAEVAAARTLSTQAERDALLARVRAPLSLSYTTSTCRLPHIMMWVPPGRGHRHLLALPTRPGRQMPEAALGTLCKRGGVQHPEALRRAGRRLLGQPNRHADDCPRQERRIADRGV